MDSESPAHIRLRTLCGICGGRLSTHEDFVPLISNDATGSYFRFGNDASLAFPPGTNLTIQDKSLCWSLFCGKCDLATEAVALHADCLKLFKEECKAEDALDRMRMAAICRRPWIGAPDLRLDGHKDLGVEVVHEKAESLGIYRLRLLPLELLRMIQGYSEFAIFWRYISIVSFARQFSVAPATTDLSAPIRSIPLGDISVWTRGEEPKLLQSPDHLPFVRLTLDCRGIRQIERLPRQPPYQPACSSDLAFIVEKMSDVEDVTIQLKYNISYLKLPTNCRGLNVWDVPSPPALEDWVFCGHLNRSMQIRTIDLRDVTGLTFIYASGKVQGIYAHTPARSLPDEVLTDLLRRFPKRLVCTYLPISKNDEVIAFGVRSRRHGSTFSVQRPSFLIRMKLAGDVYLGPGDSYQLGDRRDIILSQVPPRLLMYNIPDRGPVTVFGTYSQGRHNDNPFVPFHWPGYETHTKLFGNFSSALLQDVTHIQVLIDRESRNCRGIIFDYKNGAQRAVGNCRQGVDIAESYSNPTRICYRYLTYSFSPDMSARDEMVRVESGSDSTHCHEEGWVCRGLEGNLKFWVSDAQSTMRIDMEGEHESV
ncbi:putative Heterokaryon incompatibility domain-containing protein [Seiridium cardinale]